MANKNKILHQAKEAKKDEFYTRREDIEREVYHYRRQFEGKTVLCNCDDPRVSEFFQYFALNFEWLGLKRLICTCYKNNDIDLFSQHDKEQAVYIIYDGDKNGNNRIDPEELDVKALKGDGDFRSKECIELLKQSDVVVTNPPFSLFRQYVKQLTDYNKQFLIIGNQNAISYKEIFPLIMHNKMWVGYNSGDMSFRVPSDYEPRETRYWQDKTGQKWRSMGNITWFTNLDTKKRHEELEFYKRYTPEEYPHYDNYDAIEVSKTQNIPENYDGVMGVPITFLDKYNPNQFEILGITDRGNEYGLKTKEYTKEMVPNAGDLNRRAAYFDNGVLKATYARLLIRKKQ